jgi:hypothetical protein
MKVKLQIKVGSTTNVASVYPDKTFSGKITFIAAKAMKL